MSAMDAKINAKRYDGEIVDRLLKFLNKMLGVLKNHDAL